MFQLGKEFPWWNKLCAHSNFFLVLGLVFITLCNKD
nr:MAG TPA: hypothetical protein [Caudoviricetes sp.]